MPTIYQLAAQFRQALLRRDDAALEQIAAAYLPIADRLSADLDDLVRQIAEARANGETISRAWLYRQERYQALLRQVAAEINRYNLNLVAPFTEAQQRAFAQAGEADAGALLMAGEQRVIAAFNRLPVDAIEQLVGFTSDGTPLRTLLNRYGETIAQQISNTLAVGVATGKGAAPLTAQVRKLIDRPRWEAARIVRTEGLRAYRESTRQTYQANGITRWQWVASRNGACAACLSLDNQVFSVEKPQPSHIACRCTLIPVIGEPRKWQTGAEWFAQQTPEVQDEILTKSGGAAYRAGQVTLADFVKVKRSTAWGESRFQGSVQSALSKAEKRANNKK